ncbi:MAG: TraA family conjugative transfer protein [Thermodesulfobacteriota bacterium]
MFKEKVKKVCTFLFPAVTLAVLAVLAILPEWAQASGGTGGPLNTVYMDLCSWTNGTVGKVTALAIGLVETIGAIAKGHLMPLAVGIGAGFALSNLPGIIDSIFTATLY